MKNEPKPVDVICMFDREGNITPIRVRITDEDGEYQTYNIKNYRDASHQGTRTMPDGVFVSNTDIIFECNIVVFGKERMIRLYFHPNDLLWKMTTT